MTARTRDVEPTHPQPGFDFRGLVVSVQQAPESRRGQLLIGSAVLHGAAVAGLLAVSVLRTTPLPDPIAGANAIFVTPTLAAPAPPPPPPAKMLKAVAVRRAQADSAAGLVAPVSIPDLADDGLNDIDLGIDGGVAGGVEGGVAGGVVGGIVGGSLEAPAAAKPMLAGTEVSEPRKLVDVAPVYPEVARLARVQGAVVIDCLIDTGGRVTEAHVVDGIPLLDKPALAAVRQWRYTPTLYNGVPVPVKMKVTVRFRLS